MIGADLARAGIAATLALHHSSVAVAHLVAFGLSTGAVLFNPAAASVVPELVGEEELVDANSILWTVAVASQVILAPVAGVLVGTAGFGWAFGLNAVSYLASAAMLWRLDAGRSPANVGARGWRYAAAGLRVVRRDRLLRSLAVVQGLGALSAGATSGLLVVLAAERLRVTASGFGMLLAAIGVGAVLGPALFRRSIAPGDRRWLFGPFLVRGAVDLLLAVLVNPVLAGAALVAYGMSTSTGMVSYQSTLQHRIPADLRGRVFSLYDVVWNTARLMSLGVGGLLADAFGIQTVLCPGRGPAAGRGRAWLHRAATANTRRRYGLRASVSAISEDRAATAGAPISDVRTSVASKTLW